LNPVFDVRNGAYGRDAFRVEMEHTLSILYTIINKP
jgi:hypothetical protein